MTISYPEFHTLLLGARSTDSHIFTRLNLEAWLWERFSFGDDGVHYV